MSVILYVLKFMEVTLQTRAAKTIEGIYPDSVRTFTENYTNLWGDYVTDIGRVSFLATPAERKGRKSFFDIFNEHADYSRKRIHYRIKISPENMRRFFIFLNSDSTNLTFQLKNITTSEVWFLCKLVYIWTDLFVGQYDEIRQQDVNIIQIRPDRVTVMYKTFMRIEEKEHVEDEWFRTLTLTRP